MGISEKLNQVTARHDELREILSSQNNLNSQDLQNLSKEFADLIDIVSLVDDVKKMKHEIHGISELITDPDSENEIRSMAEQEFYALKNDAPFLPIVLGCDKGGGGSKKKAGSRKKL